MRQDGSVSVPHLLRRMIESPSCSPQLLALGRQPLVAYAIKDCKAAITSFPMIFSTPLTHVRLLPDGRQRNLSGPAQVINQIPHFLFVQRVDQSLWHHRKLILFE